MYPVLGRSVPRRRLVSPRLVSGVGVSDLSRRRLADGRATSPPCQKMAHSMDRCAKLAFVEGHSLARPPPQVSVKFATLRLVHSS